MKLLLIDTCGSEGSLALADSDRNPAVVATVAMPPRTFSEGLMPGVRRSLEAAGWLPRDLGAIAVVSGPGSFTGVRTGMSVGKGLCEALGIPLLAVSRLALLAQGAGVRYGVLDAGRGEIYVGHYRDGNLERESVMQPDEFCSQVALVPGHVAVCGEKINPRLTELSRSGIVPEPSAADALDLALALWRSGVDDVLADANYVRRTDAQIFAKPKRAEQG